MSSRSTRVRPTIVLWLLSASVPFAQVIAPGQPVPRTASPPVVFVNGYQNDCGNSSFATTFGIADQVLHTNGNVSLYFDNCTVSGKSSIERLGAALDAFLTALIYEDGSPVDVVDVVAHSMGGLIVRSYLSGKQEQDGAFLPPAGTHIRKIVFLATPHFGSGVAALGLGTNTQLDQLSSGSHFLFGLATWNDNTDDLRGVDAATLIGNGGTGRATTQGFDDGVVALTAASLGFYQAGRTRIVPMCHVDGGGLISLAGFCDFHAKGIAKIRSATDDNARFMVSFLNGTADWQTIGESAEQNKFLSVDGGLYVRPFTAAGAPQKLNSVVARISGGTAKTLNMSNDEIAYTDMFQAGQAALTVNAASGTLTRTVTVPAGAVQAFLVKPGPNISRVQPAAAAVFPFSFAPRMVIAIYGEALAQATDQARSLPLPSMLSDAQVMLSGSPLGLLYVSPIQINALLPDNTAPGLVKFTVQNSSGTSNVNIMLEAAQPAIFTVDQSGTGTAAAINARNGLLVTRDNPLRPNDYMELFLTGLGSTTHRQGLDFANQVPTVNIGGTDCPVTYAGAAPGFVGLDQINCKVPAGLAANTSAAVVVSSGARTSNMATIAVE
ncbi:MAG: hypothetical protein DMG58_19525 [Acidobacteria bacterium]|nr:MAG: hypothetical protein DMG58_19525 [Acidobacteriota bacterium]